MSQGRVLHIVESLDRGAVEKWLLRTLGHARKRDLEIDWTFYCILEKSGAMDEKAQALGARVLHSPVPLVKKTEFICALHKELRRGDYDVLHSHHDILSAVYLLAGVGIPIRRQIVHVHNADESVPSGSRFKQRVLREPMRQVCLRMADRIVGISDHTLDTFLAGRARRPGRDSVHYYGVDASPFATTPADRCSFRRKLHLPQDALILLFAGRTVPEKNPVFAVEVLAKLRGLESRAVAVFAGSGSQEQHVLERARELSVADSVRLLAWRI